MKTSFTTRATIYNDDPPTIKTAESAILRRSVCDDWSAKVKCNHPYSIP